MQLTVKCKEDFEKWYIETYYSNLEMPNYKNSQIIEFWKKKDAEKYGVLELFFDSVGFYILINKLFDLDDYSFSIDYITDFIKYKNLQLTTRPQAREKAIEKANELYNKTK